MTSIQTLEVGEMEDVIFDAQTDNGGKGISVDEMIRLFKKKKCAGDCKL